MLRFENDYSEGAHPRILERLSATNMEQTPGYGTDIYCEQAAKLIRELCGRSEAAVHFMVGGTQTNLTVISAVLRPHQGAVAADTGHINVHESGAVEATGHKVLPIPSGDGKITARAVEKLCEAHWNDVTHEHMVQPGMVYISNPTENGTIYSKTELTELSRVCRRYKLPLFMDGARLGYGLTAEGNDLTLPDIANLCDIFYIGGTKVGALFGEALVIVNADLQKDFRYIIKRHGGMLAKGRLLGVQFGALFEDGLYFDISRRAVKMAVAIKDAFAKKGYPFLFDSDTNQQFPILPDDVLAALTQKYAFSFWAKTDEKHSAVRVCTSWATKEENVTALKADIERLPDWH